MSCSVRIAGTKKVKHSVKFYNHNYKNKMTLGQGIVKSGLQIDYLLSLREIHVVLTFIRDINS